MISVVIPTYNEKENIGILIDKIEDVLIKNGLKGEVVVVDDNSPDGTGDVVKGRNSKYKNVRLIVRNERGVGTAHYLGYKKASGDIIIAMDSDLSHDPTQIPEFIKKIGEGYDIVIGSRHISGSRYEKAAKKTFLKYLTSKIGNILTTNISGVKIHDFTNGYRAIRKEVIDQASYPDSTGNAFLMEFIVKAHKRGFRVTEIPATFKDRVAGKSKLKLGRQAGIYFLKLIKYRFS